METSEKGDVGQWLKGNVAVGKHLKIESDYSRINIWNNAYFH